MSSKFDSVFDLGMLVGQTGMSSMMGLAKGWEALAGQASAHVLRSLNETAAVIGQSARAGSAEELAAIQSDYLRSAWKGAVSAATDLTGATADAARDTVLPFESLARHRL